MGGIMDGLEAIFRWLHILAGITWIGLLYFFNWVNGPFQGKIDGPTKKIVNPELMPRALYWFRWGAAYTWITGVLLLGMVYYMGQQAGKRSGLVRGRGDHDRGDIPRRVYLRRVVERWLGGHRYKKDKTCS